MEAAQRTLNYSLEDLSPKLQSNLSPVIQTAMRKRPMVATLKNFKGVKASSSKKPTYGRRETG